MARRKFTRSPILSSTKLSNGLDYLGAVSIKRKMTKAQLAAVPSPELEQVIQETRTPWNYSSYTESKDIVVISTKRNEYPSWWIVCREDGSVTIDVCTGDFVYYYSTRDLDSLRFLGKDVVSLIQKGLDELKSQYSAEGNYSVEYYLNTACAERRPTTIDDVEEDYIVDEIEADDDYDACIKAICLINEDDDYEYYQEEYSSLQECIQHFEYTDIGDGSTFITKLSKSDGSIIYDSGISKESLLEECEDEDY